MSKFEVNIKECTLPRIPQGMRPDETWGEQCESCPWGQEIPKVGIICVAKLGEEN